MKIETFGIPELQAMLKAYPDAVVNKSIAPAWRRATTPVTKEIKRGYKNIRMPYSTGLLAKSIGKRQKTYRRSGTVYCGIGPRSGFQRKIGVRKRSLKSAFKSGSTTQDIMQDPRKYAHLIELGFFHHKSGRFIPGRPVIRGAFDRTKGPFIRKINEEMGKELPKQAEKLAQKHGVKRGK